MDRQTRLDPEPDFSRFTTNCPILACEGCWFGESSTEAEVRVATDPCSKMQPRPEYVRRKTALWTKALIGEIGKIWFTV